MASVTNAWSDTVDGDRGLRSRLASGTLSGFPTGAEREFPRWRQGWRTRLPIQETRETRVRSLGGEDPLEEGVATHSRVLAWRIPMDGGAWRATVHGVVKGQTRVS